MKILWIQVEFSNSKNSRHYLHRKNFICIYFQHPFYTCDYKTSFAERPHSWSPCLFWIISEPAVNLKGIHQLLEKGTSFFGKNFVPSHCRFHLILVIACIQLRFLNVPIVTNLVQTDISLLLFKIYLKVVFSVDVHLCINKNHFFMRIGIDLIHSVINPHYKPSDILGRISQ